MKRDVVPSILDYDKETLSSLLQSAKGSLSLIEFSQRCGLSGPYLSQLINMKKEAPPTISTLKKIVAASQNRFITLDKLLQACGYTDNQLSENIKYKDHISNSKICDTILFWNLSSLPSKNGMNQYYPLINDTVYEKKLDTSCLFSYEWIFENEDLSFWSFKYFSLDSDNSSEINKQIDLIYGRLVRANFPANSKFSIVTYDTESYDAVVNVSPLQLSLYVSIILIDIENQRIVKETYLKTAKNVSAQFKKKYALSKNRMVL